MRQPLPYTLGAPPGKRASSLLVTTASLVRHAGILSPLFSWYLASLADSFFFAPDPQTAINHFVLLILYIALGALAGGVLEVGALRWAGVLRERCSAAPTAGIRRGTAYTLW